jgi:hypothetical protein
MKRSAPTVPRPEAASRNYHFDSMRPCSRRAGARCSVLAAWCRSSRAIWTCSCLWLKDASRPCVAARSSTPCGHRRVVSEETLSQALRGLRRARQRPARARLDALTDAERLDARTVALLVGRRRVTDGSEEADDRSGRDGAPFGRLALPNADLSWRPVLDLLLGLLKPSYALIATLTLVACCAGTVRRLRAERFVPDEPSVRSPGSSKRWLVVIVICAVWVALSGAGGFGYQTSDYMSHNGRLQDLVRLQWPVSYPDAGALVYYIGYYLPCALLGKFAGLGVASRTMYLWTLSGVVLSAFWIVRLFGGHRIWPVALFTVFAGLSVVGFPLLGQDSRLSSWEWWSIHDVYLARQSTTFQLFWAPHQVVPAWLLCLTLYWTTVVRREPGPAAFLVSLGCLWTPFATMGLVPFLLASVLSFPLRRLRAFLSFENVFGVGLLVGLFGVYYLGGSATTNPHAWLWQKVQLGDRHRLVRLAAFYVLEFGVLIGLLGTRWRDFDRARRLWFVAMGLVLFLSPLFVYGLWNDLHARGIVPSLVVLFIFCVDALTGVSLDDILRTRRPAITAIACMLAVGALTPVPWFVAGIREFGRAQPAKSVPDLMPQQYLGPTDSPFFRYLARPARRFHHH